LSQPKLRAQICALAFNCQIADAVPVLPHDRQMQMIVTESRVIRV